MTDDNTIEELTYVDYPITRLLTGPCSLGPLPRQTISRSPVSHRGHLTECTLEVTLSSRASGPKAGHRLPVSPPLGGGAAQAPSVDRCCVAASDDATLTV